MHREMRRQCFATTPELQNVEREGAMTLPRVVGERDTSLVLGLANRRRVWGACMGLAEVYEKEAGESREGKEVGEVEEEIVKGSVSLGMSIVAAPVGMDAKFLSVYLLENWFDLQREMELKFYFEGVEGDEWEGQSRLCGVERVGGRVFGERKGDGASVIVGETVRVEGFVLNVSGAADLRKMARVGVTGVKVNSIVPSPDSWRRIY